MASSIEQCAESVVGTSQSLLAEMLQQKGSIFVGGLFRCAAEHLEEGDPALHFIASTRKR